MSFFDDDDEEPTRTVRAPRPRQGDPTGAPPDQQTLLIRRGVAVAIGILVLVLALLGIRGCLDSRKERALKDYNRSVGELVRASDEQVGAPLFELLAGGGDGGSAIDLQTQVSQLRVTADSHLDRAESLDTPDEMSTAHDHLELVMSLRRDSVAKVAEELQTALGEDGSQEAIETIAAQNQAVLSSDVVYSQRVIPNIAKTFEDEGIGGQDIQTSNWLPNLDWLDPDFVGEQLGGGGDGSGTSGEPAPGLHGHELLSVSAGDTQLTPDSANRVPASADLSFTVVFRNGGEHDESDVQVRIRVEGATGDPITVSKTIDQTTAGAEQTVEIPLGQAPPTGAPSTVVVEVREVPGEENTDNNELEYQVLFEN